jgi:acyl carrier protein
MKTQTDVQVIERARHALARELSVAPESIRDDMDIDAELGLDSLDRLRLVFAMEKEFGVTIPDGVDFEDRSFGAVVRRLLAVATPTGSTSGGAGTLR